MHAVFQFFPLFMHAFCIFSGVLLFRIHLIQIHFCSILFDIILLQVLLYFFYFRIKLRTLRTGSIDFRLCFLHLVLKEQYCFLKLFDFAPSAEQIAAVLKCPSTHSTARVHKISFQSYNSQSLMVFPCKCNSSINMVHHKRSPQKMSCKFFKLRLHADQCVCCSDHTFFF